MTLETLGIEDDAEEMMNLWQRFKGWLKPLPPTMNLTSTDVITTASGHGLSSGDKVEFYGSKGVLRGSAKITQLTSTTFSYRNLRWYERLWSWLKAKWYRWPAVKPIDQPEMSDWALSKTFGELQQMQRDMMNSVPSLWMSSKPSTSLQEAQAREWDRQQRGAKQRERDEWPEVIEEKGE